MSLASVTPLVKMCHVFAWCPIQENELMKWPWHSYSVQIKYSSLTLRFFAPSNKNINEKKQCYGSRGPPAYAYLLKDLSKIFLEKSMNEK